MPKVKTKGKLMKFPYTGAGMKAAGKALKGAAAKASVRKGFKDQRPEYYSDEPKKKRKKKGLGKISDKEAKAMKAAGKVGKMMKGAKRVLNIFKK